VTRPTFVPVTVPMRRGSISGGRFDLAPQAILEALDAFVAHGPDEPGRLMELGVWIEDPGPRDEIASMTPEDAFDWIRREVALATEGESGRVEPNRTVVVLGGDNSITRPGVHAMTPPPADLARVGLLTIDAHHDLRPLDGGLTNGNPVRALLEDGLPGANVVQIGVQPLANPGPSAGVARDAGIGVVTADQVRARGSEAVVGRALDDLSRRCQAIYVDLDVDVLDRAFAPACPGSRPGGLHPAEVQAAVRRCGSHPKVRAMDIVEIDPTRDVGDVTVLAAASFLLAFATGVASRSPS
jgi:formiminoglutamase